MIVPPSSFVSGASLEKNQILEPVSNTAVPELTTDPPVSLAQSSHQVQYMMILIHLIWGALLENRRVHLELSLSPSSIISLSCQQQTWSYWEDVHFWVVYCPNHTGLLAKIFLAVVLCQQTRWSEWRTSAWEKRAVILVTADPSPSTLS